MTLKKTVALVGMMGAGKTSLGRKLSAKLEVPFRDADQEIEAAAGLTVSEIFEKFGEPYFRDGPSRISPFGSQGSSRWWKNFSMR